MKFEIIPGYDHKKEIGALFQEYTDMLVAAAGLGTVLTERSLDDTREHGYEKMVLDTFPFLESAVRLYRRLGFVDSVQYNDNPIPDEMIFLEKPL